MPRSVTDSVVTPRDSLEAALVSLRDDRAYEGRWFGASELREALAARSVADVREALVRIASAASGAEPIGDVSVTTKGGRTRPRYALSRAPERESRTKAGPGCSHGAGDSNRRGRIEVHEGDNLAVTRSFADASFDLIYLDPPFNTGRAQSRTRIRTQRDEEGDRVGFQGRRYRTTVVGSSAYADSFDDYMAFLLPRLEEAHRLLAPSGSFFLHLDYREVHYAKVALDRIFGRASFINEIIWAYDYGARSTNRWSAKHDNILWYAKDPGSYCFNFDAMDRIPYLAPSLVGPEKAARGKTPTDTWWHTIVSPNGREKTGYPTQKPLGVLSRIVRIHSNPGDRLLDFFAGSGSFGEAGASCGRDVTLVDENPEAIAVMRRRFADYAATFVRRAPP